MSRAFTLIELLVSLAVIALLLGIMLPVLAGAREAGRGAVCGSNLRQLMLANDLYASEQRDRFAPGACDFLVNRTRWFGTRANASLPFTTDGGPLSDYLGPSTARRGGVRACPSFVERTDAAGSFERGCGGYGYNNAFIGTIRRQTSADRWLLVTDRSGAPRSRCTKPTTTLAFGDSAFDTGTLIEYSFIEPPRWPHDPAARPDPSIHFRHGPPKHALAQFAWLDGHVSGEPLRATWSSGLYSSFAPPPPPRLGWPSDFGEHEMELFTSE